MEECARRLGISPTRLRVRMRKETGQGPLAYLTRLRLERARDLLRLEGLPVGEVARRVGYADPFYYSRRYRALFGKPPREEKGA